jgi:hypothetical protein
MPDGRRESAGYDARVFCSWSEWLGAGGASFYAVALRACPVAISMGKSCVFGNRLSSDPVLNDVVHSSVV